MSTRAQIKITDGEQSCGFIVTLTAIQKALCLLCRSFWIG